MDLQPIIISVVSSILVGVICGAGSAYVSIKILDVKYHFLAKDLKRVDDCAARAHHRLDELKL